jgi:hypothetical protein
VNAAAPRPAHAAVADAVQVSFTAVLGVGVAVCTAVCALHLRAVPAAAQVGAAVLCAGTTVLRVALDIGLAGVARVSVAFRVTHAAVGRLASTAHAHEWRLACGAACPAVTGRHRYIGANALTARPTRRAIRVFAAAGVAGAVCAALGLVTRKFEVRHAAGKREQQSPAGEHQPAQRASSTPHVHSRTLTPLSPADSAIHVQVNSRRLPILRRSLRGVPAESPPKQARVAATAVHARACPGF